MIATITEPQWFVVRGWLDEQEWGNEPPDPDDVWAVGDRVQMKGFDYVGTVVTSDSAPFLGGYLPYIFVQWQYKPHPTPIVPEQLMRLARFIPPGLTWKAEDSFSDECEEVLSVQLQQGTIKIKEGEEMVASFNLEATGFKPGQEVWVKKGSKRVKRVVGDREALLPRADRTGTGKNYGKVLTLGGKSGHEEHWEDPSKLEPVKAFESVETQEEDLLTKVYRNLPDDDVWCSVWEMVQGLGSENNEHEIQEALEQLKQQKLAKRSLNTENEVIWQKDVPANAQTQETLEPQPQEQRSLQSTTFAQEWASVSQQQVSSLEDSNSQDSVKLMTSVEISSASDTPVFQLAETLELEKTLNGLTQELSQLRQVANRLASTENGGEQTMSETSSQHSSISLEVANQNISALRMYEVSSPAPTNPEEPPEDFLNGFSGSFPSAGIMSNGKLSTAQSLELPSLENDSFWLRSPQALSSSSEGTRPPGQSKLEVQLKELGLLGPQEVLNPEFLSRGLYNLPMNWASPSVSLPATEILGINAKPTEIASIPEQPPLPSAMSSELKKPEEELKEEQPLEAVQLAQTTVQKTITVLEQIREGLHWVDPNLIVLNLGTQSRVETDKPTVKYYAEQMKSDLWEWEASPVGLLWDGEALLPWDGHHRIEAAIASGKNILARIQTGDLRRAIALSCGSNKKPSLRRTREDNQKTIEMLEDLRKQHGGDWLLQIINAELPPDKHFKEVSLRAIESYTGIPFSTIRNVQKRKKSDRDKDKTEKVTFTPTPDEMALIESIMEVEELDKPSEVFRWLLQNYQES